MTNYNERLDEVLDFVENYGVSASAEGFDKTASRAEAKQAITSLIKELVTGAKPKCYPVCENNPNQSVSSWCNKCWTCRARNNDDLWDGIEIGIEKFERNILKALEEV